jgi:hypothetical protein
MECDSTFDNTIDGPLSVSNPAVVYAELLLNIRQVSVFISLPTPSSPETRAELSSDRLSFSVAHDGRVSTLQLPTKVAEPPPLNPPPIPTKELSFRLPLAQSANQTTNADSDNVVPWTATSLAATAVLSCRKCGVTLVEARTIKAWKDLPSENWAEMMEFWHCHKPREHSNPSESNHVGKGYTASEKITADTALGLVDLCYFLLSEKDCSGVKVGYCIPLYFTSSKTRTTLPHINLHIYGHQEGGPAPKSLGSMAKSPIQLPEINIAHPANLTYHAYPLYLPSARRRVTWYSEFCKA